MSKAVCPPFNMIDLDFMVDYILTNCPQEKHWFKLVSHDGKGKYQHLIAKRAFCEKFFPEALPVAKPKRPKKSDILKDW